VRRGAADHWDVRDLVFNSIHIFISLFTESKPKCSSDYVIFVLGKGGIAKVVCFFQAEFRADAPGR
jgi:hypothetical protein